MWCSVEIKCLRAKAMNICLTVCVFKVISGGWKEGIGLYGVPPPKQTDNRVTTTVNNITGFIDWDHRGRQTDHDSSRDPQPALLVAVSAAQPIGNGFTYILMSNMCKYIKIVQPLFLASWFHFFHVVESELMQFYFALINFSGSELHNIPIGLDLPYYSFSRLYAHKKWNYAHNSENMKLMYQLQDSRRLNSKNSTVFTFLLNSKHKSHHLAHLVQLDHTCLQNATTNHQ